MTQTIGWRPPFVVAGMAGLVIAFLFWKLVREPRAFKERRSTTREGPDLSFVALLSLLRNRDYVLNLIAVSLSQIGYWSIIPFLGLYMTGVKGHTIAEGSGLIAISGVLGACGQWFSGWLSDAFGRKKVVFFTCALAIVGISILMETETVALIALAYVLFGWGAYGSLPLMLGIVPTDTAPPNLIGAAAGLTMFVAEMIGVIGPVVGGRLSDSHGLQAPLVFGACAYVMTFAVYLFMRETAPRFRKGSIVGMGSHPSDRQHIAAQANGSPTYCRK
jgi:predicted MFS family arabinose efflux permease